MTEKAVPQMDSKWLWLTPVLINLCLARLFDATNFAAIGPSQPYLAYLAKVDVDTINIIWTTGGVGEVLGALLCGVIFAKYLNTAWKKFLFGCMCQTAIGLSLMAVPFTTNIYQQALLITFNKAVKSLCQSFELSLIVFCLGPDASKSFVQLFFCMGSVGLVNGPFLVSMFFPNQETNVCYDEIDQQNATQFYEQNYEAVKNILLTPYIIMGTMNLIVATAFFFNAFLPCEMPVFSNESEQIPLTSETEKNAENIDCKRNMWMGEATKLFLVTLFVSTIGAAEDIVLALEFTFGLCGPLRLTPNEAVISDNCFTVGFLVGRFFSIFIVKCVKPYKMLCFSSFLCIIATILLVLEADKSRDVLFVALAIFGLGGSYQLGIAYSWVGEYLDLTDVKGTAVMIGRALGSLYGPIVAGYLFKKINMMMLWNFAFGLILIQFVFLLVLKKLFLNEKSEKNSK